MAVSTIKSRIKRAEEVQAAKAESPIRAISLEDERGKGEEPTCRTMISLGKPGKMLHQYRKKSGVWTEWSTEFPPDEAYQPLPVPEQEPEPEPQSNPEPKTPDKQPDGTPPHESESASESASGSVSTPVRRERERLTLKLRAESNWRINNERL